MAAFTHSKTLGAADWTGTVTVNNSNGSTQTVAASDLILPSNWNAAHQFVNTISGNTAGSSTAQGTNLVFGATGGLTASHSTAAGAATMWMSAPDVSQLTVAGGLSLINAGSTITIDGKAQTYSWFPKFPLPLATSSCVSGTSGGTGGSTQHTLTGYISPIIFEDYYTFDEIEMLVSAASNVAGTGSMSYGHMLGLYTLNGGTAFSRASSWQWAAVYSQNSVTAITAQQWWGTNSTSNSSGITGNSTASISGLRNVLLGTGSMAMTPGQYFWVHIYTARSSNSLLAQPASAMYLSQSQTTGASYWGANTIAPPRYETGLGQFSTTTNVSNTGMNLLPSSINTTAVTATGGSSLWRWNMPHFYL